MNTNTLLFSDNYIHDFTDYDNFEKKNSFSMSYQLTGMLQYYFIWRFNGGKVDENTGKIFKEFFKYDTLAKWRFSKRDFEQCKNMLLENDKNTSYVLDVPKPEKNDPLLNLKELIGFLAILSEEIKKDTKFFALFNIMNSLFKHTKIDIVNCLKTELQFLYP
ncbi:hypothetical protein SPPV_143 [Sheeppox virus]|uniref:A52R-like family protein n=2 Tax=Sheeppox virus TaxID=10266 RepID=A0A3F2YKT9_SHEVT|nr:hypothetical protein SPPV_143 [Sheeppox virus]AVI09642.1 hypothetical protein [Sheeppox virus]QEJ79747.1 hypothetical protein SPX-AbuGharib_150 [Sheeppox virus]QEJ79894.1 hypothetical protein SPX-vSaudiArabia_150 [Sheeppox virus]QEJ80190.1 hypothetical protein SPX-Pendick_150 [Sheeppox virus]QEJ80339.1 hypothetical protein SPX-SaudiArabia_150 [Sheeppox virus]